MGTKQKINSTEVIKFNNLNLTEFYNYTRPEIKMIHCVSAGYGDCSKFWRIGSFSKTIVELTKFDSKNF